MRGLARLAWAFFLWDLRATHPVRWAIDGLDALFLVGFWYFTTRLFGMVHPHGASLAGNYFTFSLVGLALSQYVWRGFDEYSARIRSERARGALECLWMSATPLPLLIVLSSAWAFLASTVNAALVLVIGVYGFGAQIRRAGMAEAALVVMVTSMAMGSLGLFCSSWMIASGRGDPFRPILSKAIPFLSGAFFPVALFPEWLRAVAGWLPMTHALNLTRGVLMPTAGGDRAWAWVALLSLTGCWILLGWLSLLWALRWARIHGRLAAR